LKKLLSLLSIILFLGLVTVGFLVLKRFNQNPEQIVPFPYTFLSDAPAIELDSPILIVGDEMGAYFAKFKTELASQISVNLAKPIKIQSLAKSGHGLHRTLHELKSITQWPQILIYQGGSEEFKEKTFEQKDIPRITTNFRRFKDDRLETILVLYPWLSRLVYEPHPRVKLGETYDAQSNPEDEYLKGLETELLLFEQELHQLISMSRSKNTLLILTTTPINLDIPPKKVCDFTRTTEIDAEILAVEELVKANNPKAAYSKSSRLLRTYTGNAKLLYLHGQIAKRLGQIDEAKTSLLEASAYDCEPWRVTEVQNSIIRKMAREHQVLLFDFAKLVENQWEKNTTFFDETHPQNLYYDKGMEQLGLVIRNILKL
jgi:hypothetical protein